MQFRLAFIEYTHSTMVHKQVLINYLEIMVGVAVLVLFRLGLAITVGLSRN